MDIVYLWCDGSDALWRNRRKQTFDLLEDREHLTRYANVEGRFRDNGELLYSLRSLELYYKERGNIYIISDGQIPASLDEQAGIQFIYHSDFLPYTPTFSSKAIEASIPFLSQISEEFLFLNDDVFFGPRFSVNSFLKDGVYQYYFFPSKNHPVDELLHQSSLSSHILSDMSLNGMQSAHTPKIISKSRYREMIDDYLPYLEKTQQEQFRDERNISFLADFYPRWMCHMGYGNAILLEDDVSIGTSEQNYEKILGHFGELSFFGINDTSDNVEKNHPDMLLLRDTLSRLFPEKSLFEK